jgi:hypothetical protein
MRRSPPQIHQLSARVQTFLSHRITLRELVGIAGTAQIPRGQAIQLTSLRYLYKSTWRLPLDWRRIFSAPVLDDIMGDEYGREPLRMAGPALRG